MLFWLPARGELVQYLSITPSFPLNLRGMKGGYSTSGSDKNFHEKARGAKIKSFI